jgi:serine/threonine-protein kinase
MDAAIHRGEVVGGKYRIEGVLGVGAIGTVYAAHHLQLGQRVALKVLRSELAAYPDVVQRFSREARAAAKIKNEHAIRVFDVGELENGVPYIGMELLEGEDLARWLAARGPLRLEEAIAYVLQACEAIVEAHAVGIAHRDLKPSNLFCSRTPDGALSIKVLDFGISKFAPLATSMSVGKASASHRAVGNFYRSPEQMQSEPDIDHRADIWALGVILFELLTTEVPFEGRTLPEVYIKVTTRPPRSLRALCPEIPEEVETTILKCLEKDRAQRFENLAEFAGSLFPFAGKTARLSIERIVQVSRKAGSESTRAATPNSTAPLAAEGLTIRPLGATVPPRPVEKHTKHIWVGIAGAVSVAVGVIFFWTRPIANSDQRRATEPSATARAASQSQSAPKMPPAPQKPDDLRNDDNAVENAVVGNVSTATASPSAPIKPSHQEAPAPPAATGRELSSDRPPSIKGEQRATPENVNAPAPRPRTRTPSNAQANDESDVRLPRRPNPPHPIDEANPY